MDTIRAADLEVGDRILMTLDDGDEYEVTVLEVRLVGTESVQVCVDDPDYSDFTTTCHRDFWFETA